MLSRPTSHTHEASQIDVTEAQQVDYWAGKFGVSETELRMAVADVGVSAQDVAAQLGQPQLPAQPAQPSL